MTKHLNSVAIAAHQTVHLKSSIVRFSHSESTKTPAGCISMNPPASVWNTTTNDVDTHENIVLKITSDTTLKENMGNLNPSKS